MLPTSSATATPPSNPINIDPTICQYLMDCVMSVIACVREFFVSICNPATPVSLPPQPPAKLNPLPSNMHFDRLKAENPELANLLSSSNKNLKLELHYLTADGVTKKVFQNLDELECRCYCDMVFFSAQTHKPEKGYHIHISITNPAQKSLKFNWKTATAIEPGGFQRVLISMSIDTTSPFYDVMTSFPQLKAWFNNGLVNLKVTQTLKMAVNEYRDLNEARCRELCEQEVNITRKDATFNNPYYLQFTFTKSDSPSDSITYTWKNIYFELGGN